MRILFFIESIHSGGKERRLVELLAYLKKKPGYELMVVMTKRDIHYNKFIELKIPFVVLERKWLKKDPLLFVKIFKICKKYHPDIVHTWGNIVTFFSLPAIFILGIPLVNGQISSALPVMPKFSKLFVTAQINFRFSKVIVANSFAGLKSFDIDDNKGKVIHNGIDLTRFDNLVDKDAVKSRYGIKTPFTVVMVASFTDMKDHNRFIDIAKEIALSRSDVNFLAVGGGKNLEGIKKRAIEEKLDNVSFTGEVEDVEQLISIADIGILLSPHGEGISNSIMEYMALGKPVIANDSGGTNEIIKHGISGFLISDESPSMIAEIIVDLLDDSEKRKKMGDAGRKRIQDLFSIERMGKEFEKVYRELIA